MEQGRIHGSISHARWAGALMEVRSLFGLNSAVKKNARRTDGPTDGPTNGPTDRPTDQPTDRPTDGWTDPHIESRVRD